MNWNSNNYQNEDSQTQIKVSLIQNEHSPIQNNTPQYEMYTAHYKKKTALTVKIKVQEQREI